MAHYLDFENPLAEIEGKAEELRAMARQNDEMDVKKEAENLDLKAQEIFDWMDSIVPIQDPSKYKTLTGTTATATNQFSSASGDLNQYSMITLVLNTNKNIPNRFFKFYDAFPTSLSGLELASGESGEAVVCSVDFRFTYYEIGTTS